MRFRSAALAFCVAAASTLALAACGSDDRPPALDIDMGSPARRAHDTPAGSARPEATAPDPEMDARGWDAPPDVGAVAVDAGLEASLDAEPDVLEPAPDASAEATAPPLADASLGADAPLEADADATFEADASRAADTTVEAEVSRAADAILETDVSPEADASLPYQCPRDMILVPVREGNPYCIDAAEVTNREYESFLKANPSPAEVPGCSFTQLVPAGDWPKLEQPSYPVTGVNWCDAYLYCAWAHKHLCGRIGGGNNDPLYANDYSKSEWFNACSNEGTTSYPYGGKYAPDRCNGADRTRELEAGADAEPRSPPTWASDDGGPSGRCEGLPGLYDMSGNVWEWEDSCASPLDAGTDLLLLAGDAGGRRSDACLARGGSFASSATSLACNASSLVTFPLLTRDFSSPEIGFRCCW